MANQSGTVTNAQGWTTIIASRNDTITFTPTSGNYTVEYPPGTIAINNASSTQTLAVTNGGTARVISTGVLTFSLVDYDDGTYLSGNESSSIRSFLGDSGILFANLPLASVSGSRLQYVSDVGPRGSLWRSDGTDWAPVGGVVLLSRGVDSAGSRTVTGTTTETSVFQYTVPGNVMGPNGALRVSLRFAHTNNANIKTLRVKFGNSSPMTVSMTPAATASETAIVQIQNLGANNAQDLHGSVAASIGGTATADVTGTIDTTVAQLLEITIQLAVGTDSASLKRVHVELMRF